VLRLLVVSSPRFEECSDLEAFLKGFEGIVVLCGDLSHCYEVIHCCRPGKCVAITSLLSDVYEVKALRELGVLAMGKWLEAEGACFGGIDARNVSQCIELLSRGSCEGIRIALSTQRLGYDSVVGWPRAPDVCKALGARILIVCGCSEPCAEPRVVSVDECVVVEACCRPITLIEVAKGEGLSVKARCIEIAKS